MQTDGDRDPGEPGAADPEENADGAPSLTPLNDNEPLATPLTDGRLALTPIEVRDVDWRAMPEGTVLSRFAAPSGDLAIATWGDPAAPRVVCVPGVTGSKEDFLLVGPALAGLGYFVQAFDLAGQYESAAAGPRDGAPYDYRLFVDDVRAFLDDGPSAHLVGYSFGGIVSMQLLAENPAGVLSLALITVPPLAGQCLRGIRVVGPLVRFASQRVAAAVFLSGLRLNLNGTDRTRDEFLRYRLQFTDLTSVADMLGLMMRVPDVESRVASLGMRRLVIVGRHDLWPLRQHRAFADRLGARLLVYPSGHRPPEQSPNEIVRDLLQFFRDSETGASESESHGPMVTSESKITKAEDDE